MDKLEKLLRNPLSHSDVPTAEQVRIWSERALERWAMENQNGAVMGNPKVERAKELVFGLSLAAIVGFLLLMLLRIFTPTLGGYSLPDMNLPSSHAISLMFLSHSTTISLLLCAAAVLATRPLREFFLEQLS
jgi:hypothetical protein